MQWAICFCTERPLKSNLPVKQCLTHPQNPFWWETSLYHLRVLPSVAIREARSLFSPRFLYNHIGGTILREFVTFCYLCLKSASFLSTTSSIRPISPWFWPCKEIKTINSATCLSLNGYIYFTRLWNSLGAFRGQILSITVKALQQKTTFFFSLSTLSSRHWHHTKVSLGRKLRLSSSPRSFPVEFQFEQTEYSTPGQTHLFLQFRCNHCYQGQHVPECLYCVTAFVIQNSYRKKKPNQQQQQNTWSFTEIFNKTFFVKK